MKETKIYIVESSEGEYSDSPSWIEKAFRRKEDAEAFARQLDKERFAEPAIEVKLWEECRTCHRSKVVGGGRERLVLHQ